MDRIILGALGVFGIVILRLVILPENSVLGQMITVGSALTFLVVGGSYALANAGEGVLHDPSSDFNRPDQG
ncbi:hypothetical protein HZA87_01075 [Candidatus Uhrbacteria bacterium]|nr:hypothetical protein [Candidatus Uhrbacteria bacterium]